MFSTNCKSSLILVATDCPAKASKAPARAGTVAAMHFELIGAQPYEMTSDEVLYAVYAARKGLSFAEIENERASFMERPRPCLRTSPLVKSYGFGIHHDEGSRVALVPIESPIYQSLIADEAVEKVPGMRSRRAA